MKTEAPDVPSDAQIKATLDRHSEELISEVFDAVESCLKTEEHRFEALEKKATDIRGQLSVAVTVISGLAGILVNGKGPQSLKLDCLTDLALLAFGVALVSGLAAVGFSINATMVKGNKLAVRGSTIFSKGVFDFADQEHAREKRHTHKSVYQRALAAHYWTIVREYRKANEAKAGSVKNAQWLYLGFLAGIAVAGFLTVTVSIRRKTASEFERPSQVQAVPAASSDGGLSPAP